ncbi:MAG: hypothetical protein K6T61_14030, partial [Bryobacteraceae bacterium]|nr:hypothetical protein [Bryobacteraceae bacterium]
MKEAHVLNIASGFRRRELGTRAPQFGFLPGKVRDLLRLAGSPQEELSGGTMLQGRSNEAMTAFARTGSLRERSFAVVRAAP